MSNRSRAQMLERGKHAETAVTAAAAAAEDTLSTTVDEIAAATSSSLSTTLTRAQKRAEARRARLPESVRFALVLVLSFSLSSLSQVLLNAASTGASGGGEQLATIARESESRVEDGLAAGWKIFLLALGWFGDYDGYDLASLALLSHGPTAYLISVFYGIPPLTAGGYLAATIVSYFVPFLLLRPLSGAHSAAPGIPNREIVVDKGIQALTSLSAGLVYNVVLFLACRSGVLSNALVLYFNDIPTVEPATAAGLGVRPETVLVSLLFGVAARGFIFAPLVVTWEDEQEEEEFDPVRASFGQTVKWNLWGYTRKTKVSIERIGVAVLATGVGTYLQCTLGIRGVESLGAAVYAGVWAVAALFTGIALRYVGSGV